MTEDDWLREKALQNQKQAAEARDRAEADQRERDKYTAIFMAQIDGLWGQLGAEVRRQVDIYNQAAGAQELYPEVHPDQISVKSPTGVLVLHLDREKQTLSEHFRRSGGGEMMGTPIGGGFAISADGHLAFSDGTPAQKAREILKELLS
jgi:hypothetical protein